MKFSIFQRLTFGYVIIMIMVFFLGTFCIYNIDKLNKLTASAASVDGKTIILMEKLFDNMVSQISFEKKYIISKDYDFYNQFIEINKYFKKDIEESEKTVTDSLQKHLLHEIKTQHSDYLSVFNKEKKNINDKTYRPGVYKKEKYLIVTTININLKKIIRLARKSRNNKIIRSKQISSNVFKVMVFTVIFVFIFGFIISFYNTKSINRPIQILKNKTKEIANGEFGIVSNIPAPPEISELAKHFNIMCKRLQELDEMKRDFVSYVSHELRTPLTVIKEASAMLLDGRYTDKPKKHKELMSIVKEECERLINSVNRILDLSCMEAQMAKYFFRTASIFPVIQKCVLKLAPIARKKNIDIELIPPGLLPEINMDEERIYQVIENLIANAIKFTSKKGNITIKAQYIGMPDNCLRVSISDTGCGIPENQLTRIFNKFTRIETGEKTILGTGLGLSISKHIVNAHSGKIWADSKPGRGSKFNFTLPALLKTKQC